MSDHRPGCGPLGLLGALLGSASFFHMLTKIGEGFQLW